MAKPKGLKLKDFFEGERRKATLVRWEHLVNQAGEPRIKLTLEVPLLNESVLGINGPVSDQFILMAKEDSQVKRANLDLYCEGMTVETWTTNESKRRNVMCTGASFHNFFIQSEGEGEKRKVHLYVVVYVSANEQWRDWAWEHRGGEFHLSAEYSQSELDFADDADEPDEDEAPAPVSAKPRLPKSGPKDRAAYHQKQNGKEAAVAQ